MHQNSFKFFGNIIVILLLSVCSLSAQKTIINDPLNGTTKGKRVGGTLTSEGFKPGVGKYFKSGKSEDHILYEVTKANGGKVIENGYVEFQVKGFRMSDFEPTSSSIKSRESGFMVLYDGRGVNEPLKYDPDSKHNYFYWVIHYRSEKYQASVGNKWKTIINCAEPISARTNSSKAVFTDATGNYGILNAKDGKINLRDRDWTVEPNGIRTSWDPNKWYTIKVEWNNSKREYKVYRDGKLVWFNELEEGRSWSSYDNSTNPAPYPWRPLDLKIWLGSGTGRYDNDMKNMYYRNFKVVDSGGSSTTPTPDYLTVSSPNGGEVLQVGNSHTIRWNDNISSNVKIELSLNNGSNWSTIVSSTSSDGSYNWTVPNSPSTSCLIRVTDVNSSSLMDVSNSKFTIQTVTPPPTSDYITVSSPNGGETLQVGNSHTIRWNDNISSNVKIELSLNNGSNWSTIVSSTSSDGSYNWTVPNSPSTSCLVRVTDVNSSSLMDVSNSKFTIQTAATPPPPTSGDLTVVAPNGGESWAVSSIQNITWTAPSGVDFVNIFFSSNYDPKNTTAAQWTKVAYVRNTGTYSWYVPNKVSSNCVIRIKDVYNASNVDLSDVVFAIVKSGDTTPPPPPPPSGSDDMVVVAPNGGESWGVGDVQQITWTAPASVKKVNIFFSSNYDPNNTTAAKWTKIAYTNNTGSYNWKVPNTLSDNCVIRIKDIADRTIVDIGDRVFTIAKNGTTPPPSSSEMAVVSPNGGESWAVGSKQIISWKAPSDVKNVNIFFTSNYDPKNPTATIWQKIKYTTNTGNYEWVVPNNISPNCMIRIKDINNTSNVDLADNNFSIIATQTLSKRDGESDNNTIEEIPEEYSLDQNYPNPFNPTTEIKFALTKSQNVRLTVYNLMGEEVKQLVNNQLNAGVHYVSFDASEFASGVYIYRLVSDGFTSTKRMTLLK